MTEHPLLKTIGKKVQEARMSKGITVRKLGELCEYDYSNLSRFENGRVNIHILTLQRIAEILNMDLKDFL